MTCTVYILLAVVVYFCFAKSLFSPFVFDDSEALVQNADVTSDGFSLLAIFKHDFWGNNLTDKSSHKSYRPLTILMYRCIRSLTMTTLDAEQNQLNAVYFHGANLIFYYLLCCQLYRALCSFLSSPIIQFSKQKSSDIALYTTFLFAAHPLHSEPVSSCVGLADILSSLCCLISFRLYVYKVKLLCVTSSDWAYTRVQLMALSVIISLLVGAALLFKEQGITYLGIYILLNCVLLLTNHTLNRAVFSMTVLENVFYLLVIFGLLYLRLWAMNFSSPTFSAMDNPASHMRDVSFRYVNYIYLFLLNGFITICPLWLCFDWSMGCVALIESLSDFRFAILVLTVIILLIAVLCLLRNVGSRDQRCMFVFAFFAVLPFLPSSNLFFPVGFVVAERNLFMPILGYLLIYVTAYRRCLAHLSRPMRLAGQICFHFLLLLYCVHSSNRTNDWISEKDLFEKGVQVCPNNAKIYYNIAKVAADNGDAEKAIINYEKALSLHENYTNALNNYANILKDRGQLSLAKKLLHKSCSLDPDFAAAFMNLAIVEMSLHNYRQSEIYFHRAIKLRPNHANTHFNLANLYLEEKRLPEAQEAYTTAVHMNGHLVRAWNNLILLHQNSHRWQLALRLCEQALLLNPKADSLHFLAANILGEQNKMHQSEMHFARAIQLRPTAVYEYNLAVLYHRNQMMAKAKEHYRKALLLDPHHTGASKQLHRLEASHK